MRGSRQIVEQPYQFARVVCREALERSADVRRKNCRPLLPVRRRRRDGHRRGGGGEVEAAGHFGRRAWRRERPLGEDEMWRSIRGARGLQLAVASADEILM